MTHSSRTAVYHIESSIRNRQQSFSIIVDIPDLVMREPHPRRSGVRPVPSSALAAGLHYKSVHSSEPQTAAGIVGHCTDIQPIHTSRYGRQRDESSVRGQSGKDYPVVRTYEDIVFSVPEYIPHHIVRQRTAVPGFVPETEDAVRIPYEQPAVGPYPQPAIIHIHKILDRYILKICGSSTLAGDIHYKPLLSAEPQR